MPLVHLVGETLEGATCFIVNREVSVVLHVRDVEPDAVKGDVVVLIVVDVLRYSVERVISIGGCVPAEGPERRERGLASNSDVSLDDLLGRTLHEEVGMDHAASCDVAENGLALFTVLDNGRHAVGVTEPDSDEFVLVLLGLDQSKRMHAIGLFESCAVIVGSLLAVSPHGPSALVEEELAVALSKTEDALRGKLEVDLQVLVHDVACFANRRKECFLRVS